jgi:hypothetical protein
MGAQSAKGRTQRQHRLQMQYDACQNLLIHDSRFVLERSTSFLAANSLLFAGFTVLTTSSSASIWLDILRVSICMVGFVFSLAHPLIIAQTLEALDFWRNTLALIERDPDYWYPRTSMDKDLDFILARARHWRGEPTRQRDVAVRPRTLPRWVYTQATRLPPNRFYAGYLSVGFAVLWMLGLLWTCSNLIPADVHHTLHHHLNCSRRLVCQ